MKRKEDLNPWVKYQLEQFKTRRMKKIDFKRLKKMGFFASYLAHGLATEEYEKGLAFYTAKGGKTHRTTNIIE